MPHKGSLPAWPSGRAKSLSDIHLVGMETFVDCLVGMETLSCGCYIRVVKVTTDLSWEKSQPFLYLSIWLLVVDCIF